MNPKALEGRVAVVSGAGRGLGRAHALALTRHGARVVVNDLGTDLEGRGAAGTPAEAVVEEIREHGGEAIASHHDVADWNQAGALIALATEELGGLDILVNNAGILRDRTLAKLSEAEWDAVVRVHLKGHAAPTRHAVSYWRSRAKAGAEADRSVVHTSSVAGFVGNVGQASYASAKLGVVALSRVVALEAARYGVRSNVVAPSARTRLSLAAPDAEEVLARSGNTSDPMDPDNVAALVVWLSLPACPATAQVFHIYGEHLRVLAIPVIAHETRRPGGWTAEAVGEALRGHLVPPLGVEAFL